MSRRLGFTLTIIALATASPTRQISRRQADLNAFQSQLHPLDYGPDFSDDPFPPYPSVYQEDGSNFTAANWRGTRLFKWKGCDENQVNAITQAWNDFHKLASQEELYKDIDWTSQAALDIWGHSTDPRKQLSDDTKAEIKQIYEAAQQMYDPWWQPPEIDRPGFGWMHTWVQVHCGPEGDDAKLCPENCEPEGVASPIDLTAAPVRQAYSEPYGDYSKTVFCAPFFDPLMPQLDEAIGDVKDDQSLQDDLTNYDNKARIVLHEMTHLTYFMNSPDKSPIVDDALFDLRGPKGRNVRVEAYGPYGVKTLANYDGQVDMGGYYTQRNADSYAWFAMAKYAESQVGL